jgi:glycosyltransferase involved in cell wall biosynthesis
MKAFDVVVAPFHQEGFGLVLAEAMAAGVPVVAVRASSTPELMEDGVEGRLVPPRDPGALAEAMIELAFDGERRACLGARGRLRAARDFCHQRMIGEHELLLALVASSRAGRPRVNTRGAGALRPSGRENPRTG